MLTKYECGYANGRDEVDKEVRQATTCANLRPWRDPLFLEKLRNRAAERRLSTLQVKSETYRGYTRGFDDALSDLAVAETWPPSGL